jgi:hypothetical protein
MACIKYTLTNTGSTIVNFNYRRCDDSLWEYQVELNPGQTKNIWSLNGTFTIAPVYTTMISLINQGAFPPISETATPTPTPSVTPSNTPTGTAAVTPTPTITPSPTEPIRYEYIGICHSEFNGTSVCECPQLASIWTDQPTLSSSTIVFSDPNGPNTGNPEGWYVEDGIIYVVATDCGIGCTTGSSISVDGVCDVTPTPTPTNTETPTNTPTVTPTSLFQTFNVFSGTTSNQSCENGVSVTIYSFEPLFDQNTQFYTTSTGDVTYDMTGFYSDGTSVTELNSDGLRIGIFTLCSGLVTPTPTPTVTETSTPTPTVTQTPTQTFAWYTYSLGSGATENDACVAFSGSPQTIYGTVQGGVGPNVGEFLYQTEGRPLTNSAPDGFYSNGTAWYQVTGGNGEITSSNPNGCEEPVTPTPTGTPTNTPTPSVTPPNTFTVTNSGTSAYIINGQSNPTLTVTEGQTYTFNITAVGHPFWIKTTPTTGTGDQYNDGVTNNGTDNGTITFVVPSNAPSTLYYICQIHGVMQGVINVIDVP